MKKILIFVLGFVLILSSCKLNNDNPNQDDISGDISNDNNKYVLGFGDYIYYKDNTKDISNIVNDINNLNNIVKKEINDIYESKYQQGLLDLFNINNEIKMTINISNEQLETLDEYHAQNNKESYAVCSLDIELKGIVYHYENVGIRQKGNTSRGEIFDDNKNIMLRHYKLSFSEEFDDKYRSDKFEFESVEHQEYQKDRTFFGMEKFNIRWNRNEDATYLKEYYSYEMYRANNVLAPLSNLMNVNMNIDGNNQNLGVYLAVEDIGKEFLKRNIKAEYNKGDLYKLGWAYQGARLDNLSSDLFGIEEQVKEHNRYKQICYPYDLKTNKKTSNHETIKSFINSIIYTNVSDYYDFFVSETYYDSVINYLAISYLLGDPDDLRGNYNNTYLYFISGTNQAIFIPTDNDRALGSTGGTGNPTSHHGALNNPFDNHTGYSINDSIFFKNSILEDGNDKIKEDYIKAINNIIDNDWMSISKFESYFNIVKNNYSDNLRIGNKVNAKEIPFNLIEINDPSNGWNMTISEYMRLKVLTFNNYKTTENVISKYYFRSDINNWDALMNYNLTLVNGIPTIELYLENNVNYRFKIATNNWSDEFNYTHLVDNSLCESVGNNKNIMVKESGKYKIQIITINNEEKLKITKIS